MKNISGKSVLIFSFLPFFFLASVFTASADFNTTMDVILDEKAISYGSASYALLTGTAVIPDNSTIRDAADKMTEMFPETAMEWNTPLSLGDLSFMIMNAYDMKGGLMYRIFPGPRYAVRELRYRKILQGKAYSTMSVSGERAVRILGRVLEMEENADEK